MTASAAIPGNQANQSEYCRHCFHPLELTARFCGECGAASSKARNPALIAAPVAQAASLVRSNYEVDFIASFQQTPTVVHDHELTNVQTPGLAPSSSASQSNFIAQPSAKDSLSLQRKDSLPIPQQQRVPSFAQVSAKVTHEVPNELREEISNLVCLLLRERIFLIIHWCIFLSMNLVGLYLSITAYNGYNGDDLTKSIMAMTPLMFINTIALACLAPIKGTKREIARLRERLSYVRFQVEYSNIL